MLQRQPVGPKLLRSEVMSDALEAHSSCIVCRVQGLDDFRVRG